MTSLVIGGSSPVVLAQHHLPLGAQHDPLEGIAQVLGTDLFVFTARCKQRCLVDQVRQVGADHPGCRGGQCSQIDVRRERHRAGVNAQDRLPSGSVWWLYGDATVEAPRPQQRGVEDLGPVGRAEHDHTRARIKAIHLGEDLV